MCTKGLSSLSPGRGDMPHRIVVLYILYVLAVHTGCIRPVRTGRAGDELPQQVSAGRKSMGVSQFQISSYQACEDRL